MQESNTSRSGRSGRGGRGGRGRGGHERTRHTPDTATFPRCVTDKYCHNHGGCSHDSPDCTRKADGRDDAVTIQNHLGGSNTFC